MIYSDNDDDFQKENPKAKCCDPILIGLILSNFVYGCNMMAVFNFLPIFADKHFKDVTPDKLSICLSFYEVAFVIFPFLHNYTLLYLGRRNALILNFILAAIQNIMFAFLEKCTSGDMFWWAVLVIRVL